MSDSWRARVVIGLVLVGLVPLTSCSGTASSASLSAAGMVLREVKPADATALPAVVAATRKVGTTMLAEAPPTGNVVTSPSSLVMALAMLTEGARSETLAELEAALGAAGDQRRDAFAALRGALNALDGDPAVVRSGKLPDKPMVHLADRVVVDDTYEVSAEYLEALAEGFGAGMQRTDLASSASKPVLSAWVEQHTGGLIKESAIEPGPDLRLVLQDAVLLAARWSVPFRSALTTGRPFTLEDGASVEVETMASTNSVPYAEIDGWKAVRLLYGEGELHADLLLPPAGVDPAAATPDLLAGIDEALDAATPEPIDLTLPTLDLSPDPLDLLDTLDALGLPSVKCDSPATDFSGMGPEGLCVAQAVQQAVLKVDEEGTVAAAVTEVAMEASGMAETPKPLHLDRPFLFQVAHTETSLPLFVAAVRDPRH